MTWHLVPAPNTAMFSAYWDFVRRTRDVIEGRTWLPAAMAAGVVNGLRTFEDLFSAVMVGQYTNAA